MFKIQFVDDGILRETLTDNYYTAITLFFVLCNKYGELYMYSIVDGVEKLEQRQETFSLK